ncbi:MAG: ABC-2 transporter permease [Lachnospiraceae bacterium]|nr:ABC-2 transporter permease [Lachnospiraceae bacterium]
MLGLLYKDFCMLKKSIWGMIPVWLIFSIPLFLPASVWEKTGLLTGMMNAQTFSFSVMPVIIYFTMFACISVIQSNLFEHDERKVWSYYITASPLGYKEQVLSKYYMTLITSFVVVVWGYICDQISSISVGSIGSASSIYTTFFYIQLILQAMEYPFVFRFGHKHGNTYKIIMFVAAFYGFMIYLLFGKFPENFSMDNVFDFLFKLASNETALPTIAMGAMALLPYIAMLLFYLSYKLSCKWYLKGVEAYEV